MYQRQHKLYRHTCKLNQYTNYASTQAVAPTETKSTHKCNNTQVVPTQVIPTQVIPTHKLYQHKLYQHKLYQHISCIITSCTNTSYTITQVVLSQVMSKHKSYQHKLNQHTNVPTHKFYNTLVSCTNTQVVPAHKFHQ